MVSDVTREKNNKKVYLFWTKITSKAESIYVGEPALPRRRNAPMRFGGGLCAGDFTETARDINRQEYFEATNIIVACIQDQFDQHGHTIRRTLESLLMKACKKDHNDEDLDVICNLYYTTRTSTKNKFSSNCSCWALVSTLCQQMER